MNGFADRGLDEDAFGETKGLSNGIRSFDAFRTFLFLTLRLLESYFRQFTHYSTALSAIYADLFF